MLATITNVLNLWLAGRIVKFSGRLKRPWPQLAAMTFPRALTAALARRRGSELSRRPARHRRRRGVGEPADGLWRARLRGAARHHARHGRAARFLLGGVYAAVLVFGWPVLALCLLGLVEAAIDLRARVARTRGPPARILTMRHSATQIRLNQVQIKE